ncbi:MAG TPA: kelch repeat-containing protein [Bryobacteraceae bacterium]|nr:kelch repeat-containing protein [Bryobacteraceae bacterium]
MGIWQGLANQPTFPVSTMILLSDGRVMVQEEATPHWHALTPDAFGSYVNGTWSTLKDMSFWRRYYASGMLKDGRIVLIGGEQSGAGNDTNKGEIYDPVADTWSPMPSPPGWPTVGDATCCILPDGQLMIGALWPSTQCASFDPVTDTWAPAASKATSPNEESWILMPDGTIVTLQCFAPFQTEKYIISSNTWKNEGALPFQMVDPLMNEIGPGMLMYNGKVIFFGAANTGGNGKTVLYTPPASPIGTGTWTPGPDIPHVAGKIMVSNDCPASLLPNGHVLFSCAPFLNKNWGSPVSFFEYDPVTNAMIPETPPANNGQQLYWSRMLLTPSGQVLFGAGTNDIHCYTPHGGPHDAWRPAIHAVHSLGGGQYLLKGTQLTGLSQACAYGDDCNPATNYPLVRLRNDVTHEVRYCRTYDFSTRAVATGGALESVRFSVPGGLPHGHYDLCVVANGISSHCVDFGHHRRKRHEHEAGCGEEACGCKCCCERESCCCRKGACCCREEHPEMEELKDEVRRLQNSVHRLASMVHREEEREEKHATVEREGKHDRDRDRDKDRDKDRKSDKK